MDEQTIQQQMDLAEQVGQDGDARRATHLYQALGDSLRAEYGPYDSRVLDAYEGMARWVAAKDLPAS
ncbi:hypothetical protein ACIQZB_00450 [Streptomyces sp. NPDC097727]|uniref:hypothetical protein n=1 Tax=Streptomyces sp. NPDC097727 TaxID=3366092 RepID=UPI0037FFFC52